MILRTRGGFAHPNSNPYMHKTYVPAENCTCKTAQINQTPNTTHYTCDQIFKYKNKEKNTIYISNREQTYIDKHHIKAEIDNLLRLHALYLWV